MDGWEGRGGGWKGKGKVEERLRDSKTDEGGRGGKMWEDRNQNFVNQITISVFIRPLPRQPNHYSYSPSKRIEKITIISVMRKN